jgi:hypothetical protein
MRGVVWLNRLSLTGESEQFVISVIIFQVFTTPSDAMPGQLQSGWKRAF